jgi:hypothetical protein
MAVTVKEHLSNGQSGAHRAEVHIPPWISSSGGPHPCVVTPIVVPSRQQRFVPGCGGCAGLGGVSCRGQGRGEGVADEVGVSGWGPAALPSQTQEDPFVGGERIDHVGGVVFADTWA